MDRTLVIGWLFATVFAGCSVDGTDAVSETASTSLEPDSGAVATSTVPQRVDPAVSEPFPVGDDATVGVRNSAKNAVVAGNAEMSIAVWTGRSGLVVGSRLDASGERLDKPAITIAEHDEEVRVPPHRHSEARPKVAFNGTDFLVVWRSENHPHIVAKRVGRDGAVRDSDPISVSEPGATPLVATDGRDFLTVWHQNGRIAGARVDAGGAVHPLSAPVTEGPDDEWVAPADLLFDGDTYGVFYWRGEQADRRADAKPELFLQRLDRRGRPVGPSVEILAHPGESYLGSATASHDGEQLWVAWTQNIDFSSAAQTDIFVAKVDEGAVGEPVPIAEDLSFVASLDIASHDDGAYLIWQHGVAPDQSVYGVRIGPEQTSAKDTQVRLGQGGAPSVAAVGDDFHVVASGLAAGYEVRSFRITGDGSMVTSQVVSRLGYPHSQSQPVAAFGGDEFFVLWADDRNVDLSQSLSTRDRYDLYGTRIDLDGQVLDSPALEIATDGSQFLSAVAFDGGHYIVAWRNDSVVRVARVTPTGEVLDPEGITISDAGADGSVPDIAAGEAFSLVVWSDRLSDGTSEIRLARVGKSGRPGAFDSITTGEVDMAPVIAFDGEEFLVAWSRTALDGDEPSWPPRSAVVVARLDGDTGTVKTEPQEITPGATADVVHDVIHEDGQFIVFWERSSVSEHGGTQSIGEFASHLNAETDELGETLTVPGAVNPVDTPDGLFGTWRVGAHSSEEGDVLYGSLLPVRPGRRKKLTEPTERPANPFALMGRDRVLILYEHFQPHMTSWGDDIVVSRVRGRWFEPPGSVPLDSLEVRGGGGLGCMTGQSQARTFGSMFIFVVVLFFGGLRVRHRSLVSRHPSRSAPTHSRGA